MDRVYEERDTRKLRDDRDRDRDRDRERVWSDEKPRNSSKSHHHHDKSTDLDRHGDHRHRTRDTDDKRHDSRVRVSHSVKDEKHRDSDSKRDRDGENHRERHRFRDLEDLDSKDLSELGSRNGREGSRDRFRESVERDKGYREDSVERRLHKRKEHGGEVGSEKSDKRIRVSDDGKDERRERRRFEDDSRDGLAKPFSVAESEKTGNREERRDRGEKRKFEDRAKEEVLRDADAKEISSEKNGIREERRDRGEKRRIEDRAKEDASGDAELKEVSLERNRIREERRDRGEKRKFEDRTKEEASGDAEPKEISLEKNRIREERRDRGEKRKFEDRMKEEASGDAEPKEVSLEKNRIREERKERVEKRKFEDRTKEEASGDAEPKEVSLEKPVLDAQPDVHPQRGNAQSSGTGRRSGTSADGASLEPLVKASSDVPEPSASSAHPTTTKVSLNPTTHENKGVSVTRSHEVPGKSSTDGTTSTAGKSASLSLDALAKAKKALQIQKELSEKLKKFPQLNKSASSSSAGGVQVGINKEAQKLEPASTATQPSSSITAAMASASVKPITGGMPGLAGLTSITNYEAVKRAQELAAKMGFHQDPEFAPLLNMFPGPIAADMSGQQKPAKAPVLRLDAQGREVDEHGNVINMPKLTNLSTLKVNINKQKKEAFQILRPDLDADMTSNPHFDLKMGINKTKLMRPKRMTFQFVEEGKWSKQAEILKFKSQFGEAQAKELKTKQAQLAKAKAEVDINPNLIEVSERVVIKEEKQKDPIPEIEWWDVPLLAFGTYNDITEGDVNLKMDKFTIYIEHPLLIEPPAEPAPPPPQPLKLTKKEQKKLRTQRRLAKEKDRQEMIRQGLIEPPKPKIKMSNLMKVLGSEATQDPTKLEMEIRSAAAEREQAHVDRNIARKLTPAERREKKERKLFEDPNTLETIVSVYKINSLAHPQTRFKVDVNAQENRLTGCAVISDGLSVVVVEGGSKSIKRYGKLMLQRINWAAAVVENEEEGDENVEQPVNKCILVWQGSAAKPSFNKFLIHQCRTEAAARKVFSDAGVAHYWDLAMNYSDNQI